MLHTQYSASSLGTPTATLVIKRPISS